MNTNLQECVLEPNGARFFRGDLHIHSYRASHDVPDSSMTPAEIIATAVQEKLAIIAIADHNEISNVSEAMAEGNAAGVLVVPAVELSTPEGHLLCYLPDIDRLTQFHGRLSLAGRGTQESRCRSTMRECLDLAKDLSGFCILAHVDGGNGYETNHPGGAPAKQDIICHPALLGIELVNAASVVTFAPGDPDPARVQLGRFRNAQLGYGEKQALARVLNSDSHRLTALGRNASEAKKLTRYKMTKPTFEGLRHALEEGDSRIRLEDEIPNSTPFVLGASFVGGFLKDQRIHFSSNLNCIIGGRGTGKSTTFEAVRCLAGDRSKERVVDSEVWPEALHLFWQDEAGTQHSLIRPIHEDLLNLDNNDGGPVNFEIDCFGQGEAARVREEAREDPLALMRYLDTFSCRRARRRRASSQRP
ncbi:AAA family ATPase [Variovorax saccharolyticus]|uniref:AAA family ATPase n=1 Tax=Variovorax saccharolyticus TaxID=3053516 RepID=UPI002576EE99|nr:AAA family ATPase [Variovorax sp. J31P216]MDM0025730.1 AAA family ATPase [Variovorax sp. J31P216]